MIKLPVNSGNYPVGGQQGLIRSITCDNLVADKTDKRWLFFREKATRVTILRVKKRNQNVYVSVISDNDSL